jgi:hypothetical protein
VLAGLGIGILYCYPEIAAVVIGGVGLFLLQRFFAENKTIKTWLLLLLCAVGLTLVGIAPFAKDLAWFIANQMAAAAGSPGVRPGEGLFRDLLVPQYRLMAFWGLGGFWGPLVGGESLAKAIWHYGESFFAFALSVLAILGIGELSRQKEWGLVATIALLCVGSLIMVFHFTYSYGAYKFILLNWWGMCFAVIQGTQLLGTRLRLRWFDWERTLLLGLLAFFFPLAQRSLLLISKCSLTLASYRSSRWKKPEISFQTVLSL